MYTIKNEVEQKKDVSLKKEKRYVIDGETGIRMEYEEWLDMRQRSRN